MDEILKKLLESELLSEDTKTELTTQFNEAVQALRDEVSVEVRAELIEQYTKDREALVENVEQQVSKLLAEELTELKDDISAFRDLEVEAAANLVEAKKELAVQLGTELDQLVEHLDNFLEERLTDELNELQEDLREARENQFGRKIFESFMSEFNRSFVDEESLFKKLSVMEDKLADAESRLFEAEQATRKATRVKKLDEVLAPLTGVKREQMALILKNVETDKLQEAYNRFVGRILKEETAAPRKPLTESTAKPTTVKTGDATQEVVTEATKPDVQKPSPTTIRMLNLAGLKAN